MCAVRTQARRHADYGVRRAVHARSAGCAVAAALDWSMVLIGYGIFLTAFHMLGGEFTLTKSNLGMFGAMFLMVGFTYGLLFSLAGAETPGMHWTQLRLTTFDGFPPERRQ